MAFRRKNDNGMNNNDQEYIIQQNEDEEWSEGVPMFLNTTSEEEDTFFHLVNSGDVAAVVRFLNEARNIDINCQNYRGYTALVQAIRNDDDAMVQMLLEFDQIQLGDAVLHAVEAGNKNLVIQLLDRMGELGQTMESNFLWKNSTDFSPDMGPLTVACHKNNYEMIRLLLCRGFSLNKPHLPTCFCTKMCAKRMQGEQLEDSIARRNAYRALCSTAYLSLTSRDPLLTAFELAYELRTCSEEEKEFQTEYLKLSEECENFTLALIDLCHTTDEVELLLNGPFLVQAKWGQHSRRFVRVAKAIDYEHKKFVTHAYCQQVLRTSWMEGWQNWDSLSTFRRIVRLAPYLLFLPLLALLYLLIPNSHLTRSWRTPFNKFVSFAYSYIVFAILLFLQIYLDEDKNRPAPPRTYLEPVIMLYVFGFAWMNIKTLAKLGFKEFTRHYWNIYTTAMLVLFISSFICWAVAMWGEDYRKTCRSEWQAWDPTLLGEVFFSLAVVMAFGRLIFLFQIGQHFGPLQISLSRMLQDIAIFLGIFLIILSSFASGLYYLYHKYDGEVRYENGHKVAEQIKAFNTLPRSFYTLYWAIYGYSPPFFADIVLSDRSVKAGVDHRFTEFVGQMLFALYYAIGIIILINLLIAMTSNSFSYVWQNSDTEWKFARTKVWMTFFDRGTTVPPPFNLIPSTKSIRRCFIGILRRICRFKDNEEGLDEDEPVSSTRQRASIQNPEGYKMLMSQLMNRYFNRRKMQEKALSLSDLDTIKLQLRKMKQVLVKVAKHDNVLISSSTLTDST